MAIKSLRVILERAGLRRRQVEPKEEKHQAISKEQTPGSDMAVASRDRQEPRPKQHEYEKRTQEILRSCRTRHNTWDCEEESPLIKDYIEAHLRKEGLCVENENYICAILDQYEQEAQYADFLVDYIGLTHASGVKNCAAWNWMVTTEDPSRNCDEKFLERVAEEGDRLAFSVAKATTAFEQGKITPSLSRRYYYVAACVYESRLSESHGEQLIHKLDILDKQCYLLRHHRRWSNTGSLASSQAGKMDGLSSARLSLAEVKRWNIDFSDMLGMRPFMAAEFGLSEDFLDEVFVKSSPRKRSSYKLAP